MKQTYHWENLELTIWELEQSIMEGERWCPEKHRRAFDPAQERLIKRRKQGSRFGRWDKEDYWQTRIHKKHIRAKYRLIREDEDTLHPDKREYHTYGWLTW